MDVNTPPPSDAELPAIVRGLIARAGVGKGRKAAIEGIYELAYKVGPKVAEAIPALVAALSDVDPKIAESALYALNYCYPDSIDPLSACLQHADPLVRERAAHSLGVIGDEARGTADAVRDLLTDEVEAVRSRAAWSLGLMHATDDATVDALFALVRSASASDRGAALHALGNIGTAFDEPSALRRHESLVMAALDDVDADVQWSALHVLSTFGLSAYEWASLVEKMLRSERSDRVVESLLTQLTEIAGHVDLSAQVPRLVEFLATPGREAALACEILATVRPPASSAVASLRAALETDDLVLPAARALWKIDPSLDVPIAALERVFGHYGETVCDYVSEVGAAASGLLPKLIEALAGDEWDLQWAAADALGAIASSRVDVMEALLAALSHPSPIVRSAAARALARVGEAAVPMLRQLLVAPGQARNAWVPYALGEIGPVAHAAAEDLKRAMKSSERTVSNASAIALAAVSGDLAALPVLLEIIESDDVEQPRRAAATALGKIGPAAASATAALRGLINDDDPEVAEAAVEALTAIEGRPH